MIVVAPLKTLHCRLSSSLFNHRLGTIQNIPIQLLPNGWQTIPAQHQTLENTNPTPTVSPAQNAAPFRLRICITAHRPTRARPRATDEHEFRTARLRHVVAPPPHPRGEPARLSWPPLRHVASPPARAALAAALPRPAAAPRAPPLARGRRRRRRRRRPVRGRRGRRGGVRGEATVRILAKHDAERGTRVAPPGRGAAQAGVRRRPRRRRPGATPRHGRRPPPPTSPRPLAPKSVCGGRRWRAGARGSRNRQRCGAARAARAPPAPLPPPRRRGPGGRRSRRAPRSRAAARAGPLRAPRVAGTSRPRPRPARPAGFVPPPRRGAGAAGAGGAGRHGRGGAVGGEGQGRRGRGSGCVRGLRGEGGGGDGRR